MSFGFLVLARRAEDGLRYILLTHEATRTAVRLPAPMRDELSGT